jgi:hypothetical protein
MKLVFKTKNKNQEKTYLVRLPNYYDTEKVDELLGEIKYDLPSKETITEHHFYGDTALTLDERKQIDIHGEVVNPPIELIFSNN